VGTDIYMYAEHRVDGQWRLVTRNDLPCDQLGETAGSYVSLYEKGNYDLFAILADVTNYPLGTESPARAHFEPIAPRRGVPDDASPELRVLWVAEEAQDRASWYLLRELLEFDWYSKTVRKHARVGPKLAAAYRQGYSASPYLWRWLQDIPGSDPNWIEGDVPITWVETYADAAGPDFMHGVLDKLREYGDLDDVRIVFSFSS